ncbi:MAG: DNA polymerase I [Ruminococcaceae bacterium]|nr:DNA polymerase I [Oscillospiraceae bacterium]
MNILVIDGNSIVNRAFYGVRPLSTRDGRPTHAIYGFMTMLNKIMEDTRPDSVAVAFDMRAPTFRHLKYAGYKAKRKGMPEELASQMQPLKDLLTALGYRIVTAEGWEADDILGTLAEAARQRGDRCVIATGDRDTLQLVGGGVTVRLLATQQGRPTATVYDEEAIKEKYGVEPPLLLDIKAIQGDTSDNIPGVPGIGEKGALDLVSRFGTLEKIYENIDSPDIKAGTRKKLIEGRESAELSRWLGEVRTDAPVPVDPAEYAVAAPDSRKVRAMMTDLELFSLLKKMDLPEDGSEVQSGEPPRTADAPAAPKEVSVSFASAEEAVRAAYSAKTADFVVGWEKDAPAWAAVCGEDGVCLLDGEEALTYLSVVGCEEIIAKRTHDCKRLSRWLCEQRTGQPCGFVFDTALAAYLINPSASDYELDKLTGQYLGISDMKLPPFLERAADACRFAGLCDKLSATLEEHGLTALLRDIELPLSVVLAEMETAGFAVDAAGIERFGERLEDRIGELERDIHELVGYEFNINSPKQLGQALFDKLGLPGGKKTKTGYSTSADALEALRGHEAVDKVLEYRGLAKLSSTYCKGLLPLVGADGRLHTTFQQTETRTGRISSTEPNLQNIPVRTELGRELRRFFVADSGKVLIDADYSQIELRVLAHMAQDKTMIDAFNNGADIHRLTAAQTHGVPIEEVTPEMRSAAKAVNFGIVYGISAFSLAKDIGVTREQAQGYINGYMSTYSGVAQYMTDVVSRARADGYASTMLGRRRYLPELAASNFNVRSFGERVARNMPVQGTAADIIKLAMVRVAARLRAEAPEARLIMQVHDELIVECPAGEADLVARLLEEEMTGAAQLDVKLEVDAHTGVNWLEAKG